MSQCQIMNNLIIMLRQPPRSSLLPFAPLFQTPLKLKQPSNFDCMIETFEKTLHSRPIGLMGGIEQELRHFRNINGLTFEIMLVYRACDKEGNEVYDCRLDKRRKKNERREGETDRLTASYATWFE